MNDKIERCSLPKAENTAEKALELTPESIATFTALEEFMGPRRLYFFFDALFEEAETASPNRPIYAIGYGRLKSTPNSDLSVGVHYHLHVDVEGSRAILELLFKDDESFSRQKMNEILEKRKDHIHVVCNNMD